MIYFLLVTRLSGYAQESKSFDLLNDDIESILPPLKTIIDSAITNNPYVKFRDLQIEANRSKLRSDRSLWVKNIGIQSDVRYGTFDNFSTNTAEGQNPSLLATRSNQFNYGVGAYIKFPIYDIVNRKNQIKFSQAELEQAQNMAELQRDELRQTVIKQYNEVILNQRLYKISSKYLETCRISMEMVEKEFLNGVVNITEYSRISDIFSKTQSDYESAKINFRTSFMILEEIVGFKFNLTNK